MIFLTEEQINYIKGNKSKLLTESSRDNQLLPYLDILHQKGSNCNLSQLKNFLMKKFVTEANIHALSLGSNFYLVGVARYYFNGDLTSNTKLNIFYPKITDKFNYDICQRLDEIIVYLRNAYIDTTGTQFEQPEDFGTLTIAQLFKKYGGRVDKLKNKGEKKPQELKYANETNVVGNDYTYDIMYSHEDCKKYNSATSPGAWCITYAQQHYNYYTKHPGSHFVIFVKNGYENIPRQVGKNFPLDEYGLSLLAVRQSNSDGSFVGCTTRWNHGHGGTPQINNADAALTYEQLKQVTGLDDEKFNIIFKVWGENKPKTNNVDRSKAAQDKLFAMRKLKYAQMLYRNGTSLQQLYSDGLINGARVLSPVWVPSDQVKINKSVLVVRANGIPEGENGETWNVYYTIMDRGEMKPDTILCKEIYAASNSNNWKYNNKRYAEEFAICETKSGDMYYFYKLHDVLHVNDNRYFLEIKTDFGGDTPIVLLEDTNHGFSVIDIRTFKPITLPNNECVSEHIEILCGNIIKFIYDGAAGTRYYYNINSGKFIDELENRETKDIGCWNSAHKLSHYGFIGITTLKPENHSYSYQIYNSKTCEFEVFDGTDTFNGVESVEEYVGISLDGKHYKIYNIQTHEQLFYPTGEPVIATSMKNLMVQQGYYGYGEKHNIRAIGFTVNYDRKQYSIFDLKTNKFYINQDGSYIFRYYGSGQVYDPNGAIVYLPDTADSEYWYEDKTIENSDVEKYLEEGVNPKELFDTCISLVSDDDNIDEKYIKVILNSVYNIIKPTDSGRYTLLCKDTWFSGVGNGFYCGYIVVEVLNDNEKYGYGGRFNYLDLNGKFLRQNCLDKAEPFNIYKECAIIVSGGYNVLRKDGSKILRYGVKEIKEPYDKQAKYYLIKENNRQRNYRYLSLMGNVFNSSAEAIYDSENGTPRYNEIEDSKNGYITMNESINKNIDFYGKYPIFGLAGDNNQYVHVVNETIHEIANSGKFNNRCLTRESLDELCNGELTDVMSSFDVQKSLNDKVWINNKINPKVRLRLLDIADKFFNSLEVNWVKPKDVIMTGSLCNYNWSKYSDIDLHIIVNFDDVDERTAFVKDYFDSKKKIWNESHENLTIYGFQVEVYVQDENEEHTASGIYSLYKDEWLKEPEQDEMDAIYLDKEMISHKVEKIADKIDALENKVYEEDDMEQIDRLSDIIKVLFDNIKGMRKDALKNGGELSTGNIIFKSLRRLGYIGKLVDLKNKTFDRLNSIK